jgi:hypothetical protein
VREGQLRVVGLWEAVVLPVDGVCVFGAFCDKFPSLKCGVDGSSFYVESDFSLGGSFVY